MKVIEEVGGEVGSSQKVIRSRNDGTSSTGSMMTTSLDWSASALKGVSVIRHQFDGRGSGIAIKDGFQ